VPSSTITSSNNGTRLRIGDTQVCWSLNAINSSFDVEQGSFGLIEY